MPQKVTQGRFGDYILKKASTVVNRKTGEVVQGCFKTYFETHNSKGKKILVKVEISNSNKEDKNGNDAMWVKFTATEERKENNRATF